MLISHNGNVKDWYKRNLKILNPKNLMRMLNFANQVSFLLQFLAVNSAVLTLLSSVITFF